MQHKVILLLTLLSLSLALESRLTHDYRNNSFNKFNPRSSPPTAAAVGITVVGVLLVLGITYLCCRKNNT